MRIKKTNLKIWLPLIISISIVAGFWLGHWAYSSKTTGGILSKNSDKELENLLNSFNKSKLNQVIGYIDDMYLEIVDVDTLAEEFIPLIIEKLDPHSSYIPAKDAQQANEDFDASFFGIGIMFNMVTDTLVILEVIAGGPSSKVGLEMGDRIIKIEKENIAGINHNQFEVVKKLRGEDGTTVNISIEREGHDELIDIAVVRGKVAIHSVESAMLIKPKIGYIKLLQFSRTTHQEVTSAIDSLKLLGMESLILDLTSNSGGLMDQASLISNEFLPTGDAIVYAKGRNGKILQTINANGMGKYTDQKLYVLIDEFSASSSEIVAGAIQDNDRGTLIGRRSFGKGLIQQQISLSDNSIIRLTIATYHTPSGRCIQKPYDMGNSEQYDKELIERFNHMEFYTADSIVIKDTVKYYTKNKRVVYAGGGIMPDVFVPRDTTRLSNFAIKAMTSINLIKFTTNYATSNSKSIEKLTSLKKVNEYLNKNQNEIYNSYINYLIKNGVKIGRKEANNPANKKELLPFLKARLGQYTPMGADAFYTIMYPYDPITNSAVELALKELN